MSEATYEKFMRMAALLLKDRFDVFDPPKDYLEMVRALDELQRESGRAEPP